MCVYKSEDKGEREREKAMAAMVEERKCGSGVEGKFKWNI